MESILSPSFMINFANGDMILPFLFTVLNMAFLSLIVCALPAEPAFAAVSDKMSDGEFIALCAFGSLQQINDAIANGASVNVNGEFNGSTPLTAAATANPDPEVITALVKAGANINAQDDNGKTPLMQAVLSFNLDLNSNSEAIITTLLELGANPKVRDNSARMAIDLVKMSKKFGNIEAIRKLKKASR